MHINDIFEQDSTTFSFEFFPPKTKLGVEHLFETIKKLDRLFPSFIDITYGAGGSTRALTYDLVLRIHRESNTTSIPHLTTVNHSREEIKKILSSYANEGISNILALRGDLPITSQKCNRSKDSFKNGADLVSFIKSFNNSGTHPNKKGFGIGVAGFPEGHPETPNRLDEMDYLKSKVDVGADYIITQLFFDNRDFYDFRERCELAGINIPILAGLMPITSLSVMKKMATLAAGARFPAPLIRAVNRCQNDDKAVKRIGLHWATQQCMQLLEHEVRGVHFYTLNHSDATRQIYETLALEKIT